MSGQTDVNALADEFDGEAKAHKAMGDHDEARKCEMASEALRRPATTEQVRALECARQAIEYSIDMGGTDPAGVLLQALNRCDSALSPAGDTGREAVPFAWVMPGSDTANDRGFIDAMAWEEGEFTKPLYASPQPAARIGREEIGALTRIAAECHRSKWQFDPGGDGFRPPASEARRLVGKAFDVLHNIGDLALKEKAALTARDAGSDVTRERQQCIPIQRSRRFQMNMVIGFGSTEQKFEAAEEAALVDFVSRSYREQRLSYFSDQFCNEVDAWLYARAKSLRDEADGHKTSTDFPPRYSYYWSHTVSDASYIIAVVKFHHINRRHGLSPDGWGLMATERLFKISSLDLYEPESAVPATEHPSHSKNSPVSAPELPAQHRQEGQP